MGDGTAESLFERHSVITDDAEETTATVSTETAVPLDPDAIPWQRDLLVLFLKTQIRVAPALPILALLLAITSLQWAPPLYSLGWAIAAIMCQAIQMYVCQSYFFKERAEQEQRDWIGIISAAEVLIGVCWVLPLFLFWDSAGSMQRIYLVASTMAVIAARLLMVNSFMPVLIAGTGVLTIGVALRCVSEGGTLYLALAGTIVSLEAFFLLIARNLQDTARDMLIFKAQKESLFAELEREKAKAEEQAKRAEAANNAKTMFLATMSHELRTPLNAIMGFSEVLKREMFGPLNVPIYKNYADDIHHSGHYLLALINDILDVSRIEAGRRDLHEEPLSVLVAVEEANHLLLLKAAEKSIDVSVKVADTLPKILADKRSVNQILINIFSNAIKFTPNGGKVAISANRTFDGGLSINVQDNGHGIPPHEVEQAFKPFTRGTMATRKAIDGAGLGLAIAKGLLELHQGQIEIEGVAGKGTTVKINFPAERVLDGPRGQVMAAATIQSESQRKLIAITG